MYNIDIICVGKLKEDYLRGACAEYSKRLSTAFRSSLFQSVEKVCHRTDSRLPCVRGAVTAKP